MTSRPIAVTPDPDELSRRIPPQEHGTRWLDYQKDLYESLCRAVTRGGAHLVEPTDAEGLIWAYFAPIETFATVLGSASQLEWIQLPYAGVEPFVSHLDSRWKWTCGKDVYAPAVAESALGMILAGQKHLHGYSRATSWSAPEGRMLAGSRITVLGGGGITRRLLALLEPFDCDVTVIRRQDVDFPGADRTLTTARLHEILPRTDVLVLALALTAETRGIISQAELDALSDHAWIVNVARGAHVVTDDLLEALRAGTIGGAALDVTDPEPLPDGHPLWSEPRCFITPHVANTPQIGLRLLEPFVAENVRRFCARESLLAPVNIDLGY